MSGNFFRLKWEAYGSTLIGYDFSVDNWGPQLRDNKEFESRIQFKPYKLAPVDAPYNTPPEYSLQGLMKKNSGWFGQFIWHERLIACSDHKFIDILKLDIEGSEFDVLDSLFKQYEGRPLPFGQLQLEIHVGDKPFADFLHWWERLEAAGLRPFWTEASSFYDAALQYLIVW